MAKLTNIDDANKMIDDLTKSLATKTDDFNALQTKHSDLITQNGQLVKEKAELWDLVASGKKPAPGQTQKEHAEESKVDLDAMDM